MLHHVSELSDQNVADVLKILAERARASERIADSFIPPYVGVVEETAAGRHQLVVGRRGVGKSMLLLNLVSAAEENGELAVAMDLESLSGIPYPDVLIRLVSELAGSLRQHLRSEAGFFKAPKTRFGLWRLERQLNRLLQLPQEQQMSVQTAKGASHGVDLEAGMHFPEVTVASARIKGGFGRTKRSTVESVATFTRTKMEGLQSAVPDYRKLLKLAVESTSAKRATLVLDDFYFIPQDDQPDVLAYLHQLVKGLEIWLKIGGVEHRLNPFEEGDPPRGLQPNQDAGLIRLDATLTNYEHTQGYLEGILEGALDQLGVEVDAMLTDTGRERLVLASGGVPRDYLNLTAAALRRSTKREDSPKRPRNRINAEDVSEVAPAFLDQKEQDLARDARPEDVERLRKQFDDLVTFCVNENRRNAFVVEATRLREEQWGRDIAALAELRFIHKVANLTVKSSSPEYTGRRYEAFVLDLSAYAGTRVRNIEMITFWETEGKQKIRGATFIYKPEESGSREVEEALHEVTENEQMTFDLLD